MSGQTEQGSGSTWNKPYFLQKKNQRGSYKGYYNGSEVKWKYSENGKRIIDFEVDGERIGFDKYLSQNNIPPGRFWNDLQSEEPRGEVAQAEPTPEPTPDPTPIPDDHSLLDNNINYDLLTPGMQKDPIDPETNERPFKEAVIPLQKLLVAANEDVKVDGYFGDDTEAALIKFQAKNGLAPTGELTEETLKVLRQQATPEENRLPADSMLLQG